MSAARDTYQVNDGPSSKRRRTGVASEPENDAENEGPACQSCRKRKAKCTRQQPCSNCLHINVDCIYDEKRKPGMRPGAIEGLNRRVATLEQMIIGQGILLKPLLERALQDPAPAVGTESLTDQLEKLKDDYLRMADSTNPAHPHPNPAVLKRPVSAPAASDPHGLSQDFINTIIDWYFLHIHPWIPILHVKIFRENLRNSQKRAQYDIISDAIVSLCLRFCPGDFSVSQQRSISTSLRHSVILRSMDKFSVESLQALVIISFDIIGSGRGPSAWSLVGSMTRTVEQLRLSVEEDAVHARNGEFLIRRMSFLKRAETWAETEERRRVFWNVFLMDRFCSIATGWNNSLTSADVQRRLPCEGAIWEAGRPVRTPLFGIAERPPTAHQPLTPTSERLSIDDDELNSIGGFAFCIEATESLNLVTSFFLQHPLAFNDMQEMQLWLVRFKELDLRLIKWRLFLPPQWRNASVLNQDGIMDPNLTLAHITHNTAVIQLHQCIAYPAPQWRASSIALPSTSSADTCLSAAAEISTIADMFLRQSMGVTNPQFSFCLFIAGRVLLAHSTYNSTLLHPAFTTISTSLTDIGQRWAGTQDLASSESTENLALRFSKRLASAKATLLGAERPAAHDPTMDIRQPVYSDQSGRSRATSATPQPQSELTAHADLVAIQENASPDSISLAFPPLPFSFEQANDSMNESVFGPVDLSGSQQELNFIFDDQYQQMLRVSTFAEANRNDTLREEQSIRPHGNT